jgi:hypothetical protein
VRTDGQPESRRSSGLRRTLAALVLLGVSFGYIEAAVVVYLRGLYEPIHERLYPGRTPGDLFPLVPLEQLQAEQPRALQWLAVELGREAATLLLLAGAALACARSFREWFAGFLVTFGIWDIFYYVFLKLLLDWPASLLTWDLLFLLPVPWAAPVLAPVLVALLMVATGTVVLRREAANEPLRLGGRHWLGLVAGGLLLVLSFCWDYRRMMAGGQPDSYPWPLLALGTALALASFLHALGRAPRKSWDAARSQNEAHRVGARAEK